MAVFKRKRVVAIAFRRSDWRPVVAVYLSVSNRSEHVKGRIDVKINMKAKD